MNIKDIKDLVGLSKPLTRLIEVVSTGIGTYWAPKQKIRMAVAEAQAAKILALNEMEILQIKEGKQALLPYIDQQLISPVHQLEDVPIEFRAATRLKTQFLFEQDNIESIAGKAIHYLPETIEGSQVDRDWIHKYFKLAAEISKSEMQEMWAKVLAQEVSRPGQFSRRSLDTLSSLSKEEGDIFVIACSIVFNGDCILLPNDSSLLNDMTVYPIPHLDMLSLINAGLVSSLESAYFVQAEIENQTFPLPTKSGTLLVKPPQSGQKVEIKVRVLTEAGRQLASLVETTTNKAYFERMNQLGYGENLFEFVEHACSK